MSSFREKMTEFGSALKDVGRGVGYMGALAIGLTTIGYAGPPILGLETAAVGSSETGMQVGITEPRDLAAAQLVAGAQAVREAALL